MVYYSLKPYPAYKPSGVEWLGKVPAHWGLPRLGTLLRERKEMNDGGKVSEVLSLLRDRGVIPYDEKGNVGNKKSEDITRYKVVRPEDIVVNCMNVIIGSVGLSSYTGCLSPVYYVLTRRSEDDYPRYLNAYFQTKPFQESLVRIGNGILAHRMRIPMELLKCESFPHPPPEEQAAIALYLDHADRRIRSGIRARERLVELLEEQRQALVNEAVTGRVDVRTGQPYPAFKPSGVEWLGEVPAHWETKRLKWVSRLQRGYDLPADRWIPGSFPVVSSGGIIGSHAESKCTGPGVVLGRCGSTDAVFFVERDFWPHNTSLFVTNFYGNNRKWCYYLLNTISKEDHAGKSAVPAVDRKDLFQIIIAVPPIVEQGTVARYLDCADGHIQSCIHAAQRQIELLGEYRTRLISDVVTGKLDVRDAAAALSERDTLSTESAGDSSTETAATPPSGLDPKPRATRAPA